MKNRRVLSLILALVMVFSLSITASAAVTDDGKVVILHTNDVHCGIDHIVKDDVVTRIGYSGLMAVKTATEETYGKDNVILVDCGDSIQGESMGTLTKGEALVDLMNQLGYSLAAPGNHEFDWGVDNFAERVKQAEYTYLCCNLTDLRTGKPLFDGYKVVEINGVKVGFVGIDTPETFFKSTPTYFKDAAGNYIYSFSEGNDGKDLYNAVQKAVDAAKADGAQYIVALAHLGIKSSSEKWQSQTVIANTTGIDVMLDGHSHEAWTKEVANKDGKTVILQQTGTKLANIGKVTIDVKSGKIEAELIPAASCTTEDATMAAAVKAANDKFAELLDKVVAKTEVPLYVNDPETGKRIIRNTETSLANLVTDAYLNILGADVAYVNGGGIRADIAVGDVTYSDIIKVHPYGNQGCLAEVTGQQILDALELGVYKFPGESGGFPHVAGMTYTINVAIPTSVVLNDNGEFVEVSGARRVSDVMIGGKPIDPQKTYKLASTDYYLKDAGDGYTMLAGSKLIQDGGILDNEILINYITNELKGEITAEKYGKPQGRITIIPDPIGGYTDVDASLWYAPALRYVVTNGSMTGTGATTFAPKATITRAEVMKLIANMAGADTTPAAGEKWYDKAVAWAVENKISDGKDATAVSSREDFVIMLYNYVKMQGKGYTGAWMTAPLTNPDIAEVSEGATEAMYWMVNNNVIKGVDAAGTLAPKSSATRAEMAQILLNMSKVAA